MRRRSVASFVVLWLGLACAVGASAQNDQTEGPIELFNGENLDGLQVYLDDPTIDPNDAWKVENGVLRATAVGKGYIRTGVPYADYRLHVEWRWPKGPGNSGVMVNIVNGDVLWPKSFEAQLKTDRAGDFASFSDARSKEEVVSRNPSGVSTGRLERSGPPREKPLGEWNSYDITVAGDTIMLAVNGEEVNRMTDITPAAGFIGLQTEGTPIDFRNVTLTLLPPAKDMNAPMPAALR